MIYSLKLKFWNLLEIIYGSIYVKKVFKLIIELGEKSKIGIFLIVT